MDEAEMATLLWREAFAGGEIEPRLQLKDGSYCIGSRELKWEFKKK